MHLVTPRNTNNFIKKWWCDIDKISFSTIICLILFGLVATTTSSVAVAKRIEVGSLFFIKKQLVFATICIMLIFLISLIEIKNIKYLAISGILISFALLISVLFLGSEAKGSKRWLSLFGFTLQPSEFAKTFFVIANAYLLQELYYFSTIKKYSLSITFLMIIAGLIIFQPDFGMALTFFVIWFIQIFCYGFSMKAIIFIIMVGLVLCFGAYASFPHIQERVISYLGKISGKNISNYQVEKASDAFANGSFFGTGLGNGVVKNFIPDAHTDFIFAVIAEEFGIVSCLILIIIFISIISRIFNKIFLEKDLFIYLALIGLITQFTMQVAVNISVSINLIPTKGMTLPFISYGGSSMISMAICFGLILALTKKKYHQNIDYGNVKLINFE